MRKSVLLPAVAAVGGAVGLLVRRVYLANGFEVGTGLPIPGAPSMWAMLLVAAVTAGALALLCQGKHRQFDQCYTGAFSSDRLVWNAGALAGGVLLAIGGALALFAWVSTVDEAGQRTLSLSWAGLGLMGLLAGAGIYFVQIQMRRRRPVLTAWATAPGFAGCLWLMANYYTSWAAEPSLGRYGIPVLGMALSLAACVRISTLAFAKVKTGAVLFLCLSAAAFDLMALADGLPLVDTALYLGMFFSLLSSAGALAENDAGTDQPPCTAHCDRCAGCTPMGTLKPPETKKKKKKANNDQNGQPSQAARS